MSGEEKAKPVAETSVGQQLRRARESLGLSVGAIADQQHLRPSIIQSIEAGQYSKIDTELFLKGYVRAYARQVGLDPDAVIGALDAELEPLRQEREQQQKANPLVDIARKKKRKRQIAKFVMVMLLLLVAGGLIFNYAADKDLSMLTGKDAPESVEDTPGPDARDSIGDDWPAAAEDNIPEAIEDVEPDAERPDPAPDAQAEQPGAPVETADVEADNASGVQESNRVAEDAPESIADAAGAQPVVEVSEPEVTAMQPAATTVTEPVAPGVRLEMAFADDCWVQVSDGEGNRLASALRRRGDTLDVSGQPPLRVVIGAMSAVQSLEFQGERLDLASFRTVNNRSEFTLEP